MNLKRTLLRTFFLFALVIGMQSCAGAIMGAGVSTAVEVVKVPFKVAGAAVDLVVPDDEDPID